MKKVQKPLLLMLFLVLLQPPAFTFEIHLDSASYEPGDTITIELLFTNSTTSKECLQTVDIVITDPTRVVCTLNNSYPADTECIDPGQEKGYTFTCTLPITASKGVAVIIVDVVTWSSLSLHQEKSFEIHINDPPEITLISSPDVVNPSSTSTVTFSVSDNFGVEDLRSLDVSLYKLTSAMGRERELSQFTWKSPHPYTVWEGDRASVTASLQNQEIVWTLHFQLSEIASPGEWMLEIYAYDAKHQHQNVVRQFTVTKYVSFHVEDESRASLASVSFGKALPGEELPLVRLHLVVTSNTPVNVFVQAGDLHSPEGNVLPVTIFFVQGMTELPLDGSRQIVYTNYAEKKGFCRETRILLVFRGKLPEAMEAGTYSGVWYIIVEAV